MEFESVYSYSRFAQAVSHEWRYTRGQSEEAFLTAVLETAASRVQELPKGTGLWRAQEGCDWPSEEDEEAFSGGPSGYSPERMKPLRFRAREGRANPKGIPYLYTATHQKTAIAEIRPWIGAYVSVGHFELARSVRIVNCTSDDTDLIVYTTEPSAEKREKACWRDIDRGFAKPVDRGDETPDYVPTQILAETFRRNGLDGIGYRSSLGPGHNVVLFDMEVAVLIGCCAFEVEAIDVRAGQAGNPYVVRSETAEEP